MSDHPIEGLMTTAMQSIKEMVDVNTIVGDAVQAPDGTVIIPISKVCFGFAAGGGDYGQQQGGNSGEGGSKLPFAGGSGAGVTINPVAFMICGENNVKLLPVDINSSLEKVLDLVPGVIEKINDILNSKQSKKNDNCCSNKKKNKDEEKDKEQE